MADREWERELAEIDRRLASVPDPQTGPVEVQARQAATPAAPRPAPAVGPGPAGAPAGARAGAQGGRTLGSAAAPGRRSWRAQFALLFRLLVGAAVVAALVYWPYPAACGAGLAVYLALVGALGLAGVATSTSAWRHRAPFVHLLGLAMVAASAVLGAREVLPRVGYAVPNPATPATWACVASPPGGGAAPAPGG
jgi:hypothetical protein